MKKNFFGAYINGVGLHDLEPEVYVMDVVEDTPQITMNVHEKPKASGMQAIGATRQQLSVTLKLVIRARDMVRRAAIMDEIHTWA